MSMRAIFFSVVCGLALAGCKDTISSSPAPGGDQAGAGKAAGLIVERAMAETLFVTQDPKTLLVGVEAVRQDGQSTHRREVWSCGPLVPVYEYSDRDYQSLQILPVSR